jgi:hypothetical protein
MPKYVTGALAGADITKGDWVSVVEEHDIPVLFRPDGKPTTGRVERVENGLVEVWVPIGGADVDEHSQAVFYPPEALVPRILP